MYPRAPFLILPFTRMEIPGWGLLFHLFKVGSIPHYPLWKDAPTKYIRGKWHRYRLRLELSDWSERHTYFLGRYCELHVQLAMIHILRPGDRFVDIGANIGMITLHGAALVTPAGCVDSFDPHPECYRRVREVLSLNGIQHVQLHQVGLSDEPDDLVLSVVTDHLGMSTLAAPCGDQGELVTDTLRVSVITGDSMLLQNDKPIKLVKIDVEGFEFRVLNGLQQTLKQWHPIVVTEAEPGWLARAGASRTQLLHFMKELGYAPYSLATKRRYLRHRLVLRPIPDDDIEREPATEFLWMHPHSAAAAALQPAIEPANS